MRFLIDDVPGSVHGACVRERAVEVFGSYAVRRALRTSVLTAPWPRVLMAAERQLEPRTRAAAGLLAVGPAGVLCGFTAAWLHGCDAVPARQVDVVVPYDTWPRPRPGLAVHHGRVAPEDVRVVDGLPVLALDLAIAELLCTARSARAALACADQACTLAAAAGSGDFVAAVLERIDRRRDRRGTVRAAALAALVTAGVESPQESWLRLTVVEHGYPRPVVQHEVRDPCGTPVRRLDLAWPQVRIGLEYDGHAEPTGRADQDRDLARRGWVVVRATVEDLGAPGRVLALLAAAFHRRGGILGATGS